MDSALKNIKKMALSNHTQEICGFLVRNGSSHTAIQSRNDAKDKENFFQINPSQYLAAKLGNEEIVAVFHSHIKGSADPSDFDKKMSAHCDLDFLIYSIEDDEFKTYKKK